MLNVVHIVHPHAASLTSSAQAYTLEVVSIRKHVIKSKQIFLFPFIPKQGRERPPIMNIYL